MKSRLIEYIKKLFQKKEPVKAAEFQKIQTYVPDYLTHAKKWQQSLDEKGMDLSQLNYLSLRAGKAVFTRIGAEQRDAWVMMTNVEHAELKIMPSHYEYDIKAVLSQLPIVSKEPEVLQRAEHDLKRGWFIDTEINTGNANIPVRIEADPLNRSVRIKDSLGKPVSLKDLKIDLAPPLPIHHYRLCEGEKVLFAGKDYLEAEKELHGQLSLSAKAHETRQYHVVGMTDSRLPTFDAAGKITSEHTPLVLSGESYPSSDGTPGFQVTKHILPGDIATAYEKDMRDTMKHKPFVSDSELRNSYESIRTKREQQRESFTQKSVVRKRQQQRIHH